MTEPTFNNILIVLLYRLLLNMCTRNNCIDCDICEVVYSDDEIDIDN